MVHGFQGLKCEFGGYYVHYNDNWIQFGGNFRGNYDACQIENNILTGDFNRVASGDKGAPYNEELNSDYNLTVQNDVDDFRLKFFQAPEFDARFAICE
ncbi:hypothetical protein IMCC3135_01185 [Granulosicoccus antarcticus IMCC3135]|uniref:Uncharacterized protein n=2 Tax=Granulosicoccus TaxID=437504 RepID=A0A2Z2NGE4_9GAMM|nr:hypothetical protein IMCC3135_01185 [Granulosicoccus antarcticus IMCC3135]